MFNLEDTGSAGAEKIDGDIAQLGERLPCKQEVVSSILIVSTRSCHVGYVGVCAVQLIT